MVPFNRVSVNQYLDMCKTNINPNAKNDPEIFTKMRQVIESDPWMNERYPHLIAGLGVLERIELTVPERHCFLGTMCYEIAIDTHHM